MVADIYEASLSPAHWDLALTGLVSRFGPPRWDVAMLVWERLAPGGGRFVASAGVNDQRQETDQVATAVNEMAATVQEVQLAKLRCDRRAPYA